MPTFLEMENLQSKHVSETQSSFTMKLLDQRKESRIDDDIMTRRMKNRERQRRYRARKRLEEEVEKAPTVKHPTQTEVHFQPNDVANNSVSRVYCNRNWKKEARRAKISRGSEPSCNNMAAITLTSESRMQSLPSNIAVQSHLELPADEQISKKRKKVLGRRDWKADARKKGN